MFSRVKLELSDEELYSPGVPKLLLDNLTRAEAEVAALASIREKYHDSDKRNGVLEEKLKTHRAIEATSTASLVVGAASLGFAPKVWNAQPAGWIALAFGVVLIVIGIWAKWIRR